MSVTRGAAAADAVAHAAAPAAPAAAAAPSARSGSSSTKKKTVLKVILLGQSGVGKTSLLNRFVDDAFQPQYKATLGADMRSMEVTIGDEPVVLQLWDTAGQERFNSLNSMYFKGAQMALLVFDITRSDSFEALTMWRDQFAAASGNDKDSFPFACVGSKCDVASQRAVSQRRANTWCAANGNMPYFECSAKDATNVRLCFMTLARQAVKKMQQERAAENAAATSPPPSVVLAPPTSRSQKLSSGLTDADPKKESSCCA